MASRYAWGFWGLCVSVLVALVAYFLPWYAHSSAGFTMNAWDLAEWSSLHPAVRSSSPPMLTSLLLRVPHVTLVVVMALVANRLPGERLRWVARAVALAFALRMVPPTEFFSGASADPNYRQMALLTGVGVLLVVGSVALGRSRLQGQIVAVLVLLVLGVISGWTGLSRAGTLLDNFEIAVTTGRGILLYTGLSLVASASASWDLARRYA